MSGDQEWLLGVQDRVRETKSEMLSGTLARDEMSRIESWLEWLEEYLGELIRQRSRCVECDRPQFDSESGWRMYLTIDDEPALYCPECAAREFGGDDA